MDGFQMSDWVAIVSAAISVLALMLNIVITSRQTRVSVENFKFNNDTQLMSWANRVVVAMAEAYHLTGKSETHPLATSLSALIDEGRWFFPNIGKKETDNEKPGAYRGTRQAVLDHIVAVYDAVVAMPNADDQAWQQQMSSIHRARRHFVTEIQQAVDPRRRAWVMDRFRKF
ncbi:MAG: hypothetical protein HOP13_16980 [Alphaproteobacteria bacterium]|nr:hypothetical protein [Alphaproteobacteria bacterium]